MIFMNFNKMDNLDNETVEYNNQVFTYNYGKLKRLRNDYAS